MFHFVNILPDPIRVPIIFLDIFDIPSESGAVVTQANSM